ncbi:MAG: alpha/beta fold hydrolase [Actinomycetota bacterium]|jgi:pimeloyl-ACP methyl ester carboxylesterase
MTEGRAPVDGGTLHYEVAGDGPGVVLVHPGLWDSRTWDVTFPVFAERHRVLRYDMRGYGRSDRPTGAFSHVEDLRAVMETAGIERAAIVGNSIGGAVAIEFVLEHPEMATALVAIAPGLDGFIATFGEPEFDWDTAEGPIEAAVEAGDLDRALDLEMELWAPLGTADPAGARIRQIALENVHELQIDWSLSRRLDPRPATRLGEISVPTLGLIGSDDVPGSMEFVDAIVSQVSGATKVVIEGADHVLNMRQPEEFDRVVLGFIDGVA